jgi:hypothetical protein
MLVNSIWDYCRILYRGGIGQCCIEGECLFHSSDTVTVRIGIEIANTAKSRRCIQVDLFFLGSVQHKCLLNDLSNVGRI